MPNKAILVKSFTNSDNGNQTVRKTIQFLYTKRAKTWVYKSAQTQISATANY